MDAAAVQQQEEKHPDGLYVLFFTEMWERFGYYGMRGLLVLYMIKGLDFSQPVASRLYGWYTGLVYLTPIFGGLIADRVLGYRKSIISGAVLLSIGYFVLGVQTRPLFFVALFILIIGNGLFKANISTLVGKLYRKGDPRRDAGFSIFYMGINLGAAISPFICSPLGEKVAWRYGFWAAGVGMLIALVTFISGQPRLAAINVELPEPTPPSTDTKAAESESEVERGRILALAIIALFTIFFWMAFEQAGNTMTLWADVNTVRLIHLPIVGDWEIPASMFQAVNATFIIVFAPLMGALWLMLGRKGWEPSTTVKFVLGLFFLGLGFVAMVAAAISAGSDAGKVSALWLVLAYFMHTIGELCLSPIGLSLVTKLAPVRLAGMLMGVWFVAIFVGNWLAGFLGGWWQQYPHKTFFGIFVVTSWAAAAVLLLMVKPLKRLMAGAA